jgi:hypothetical protein
MSKLNKTEREIQQYLEVSGILIKHNDKFTVNPRIMELWNGFLKAAKTTEPKTEAMILALLKYYNETTGKVELEKEFLKNIIRIAMIIVQLLETK